MSKMFKILIFISLFISIIESHNVALILTDDLTYQFANNEVVMPNFNRISKEKGVTNFVNAQANACICSPSRASLLTGKYPSVTQVLSNKNNQNYPELNFIMDIVKSHNFTRISAGKVLHTSFTEKLDVNNRLWDYYIKNLNQKFETRSKDSCDISSLPFINPENRGCRRIPNRFENQMVLEKDFNDFVSTLKNHNKFFASFGIRPPHAPYNIPKKYWKNTKNQINTNKIDLILSLTEREKFLFRLDGPIFKFVNNNDSVRKNFMNGYVAAVNYADHYIGKTWDHLIKNYGNDTMIIITSDQGFHIGNRNSFGKSTLFNETLRIPLLIYYPETKNKIQETKASLVDLFPTILEFMDIEHPTNGRYPKSSMSLKKYLFSEIEDERTTFAECETVGQVTRSAYTKNFSLITYFDENQTTIKDLYNISKDKLQRKRLNKSRITQNLYNKIRNEFD